MWTAPSADTWCSAVFCSIHLRSKNPVLDWECLWTRYRNKRKSSHSAIRQMLNFERNEVEYFSQELNCYDAFSWNRLRQHVYTDCEIISWFDIKSDFDTPIASQTPPSEQKTHCSVSYVSQYKRQMWEVSSFSERRTWYVVFPQHTRCVFPSHLFLCVTTHKQ